MISTSLISAFTTAKFLYVLPHSVLASGCELRRTRMKHIKVIPSKHLVLSDISYNMNVSGPAVSLWAMRHALIKLLHLAVVCINFMSICTCLCPCLSISSMLDWQTKCLFSSWTNFTEHTELLLLLPAHTHTHKNGVVTWSAKKAKTRGWFA